MKTIDLERWEPKPDDPRYVQYAGPRTAGEVFAELKERLDSLGLLPDEYFLMDTAWDCGREIPKDADIFCTTDYGESEGVYLDVYLKWYEDGERITKSFATGKTLGDSGADLDRMFLISSAITKAFHGDHGTYARCTKLGGVREPESMVVSLTPEEQRVFIDALIRQREEMLEGVDRTEKLLRRMTGSITAYMDEVGQRPLRVSTFDRAMLAIRDGETKAFADLLPQVTDRQDELLTAAAGRPGAAGRKMLVELLAVGKEFSDDVYLTACKQAVDTTETQRVQFLLEQAEANVEGLEPSFYGEVIQYAYNDHPHIAGELIRGSTPAQIAAAPSYLLYQAVTSNDYQSQYALMEKGIDTNDRAADVLHYLCCGHQELRAKALLESGLKVEPENYLALESCVKNGGLTAAKVLLDQGMDFERYKEWRERRHCGGCLDAMQALEEHWEQLQSQQQGQAVRQDQPQLEQGPRLGEMSL